MSALAKKLATVEIDSRIRRGPSGACDIYGDGDMEDWAQVERLRLSSSWAEAQVTVDEALGVKPIDTDKFRYHWRRRCWHWNHEQRQIRLEDIA
jgi:hypothetical protein